ncbi:Uncharacterized protein PHPALM_8350, partial [Phytophthora palmivora]
MVTVYVDDMMVVGMLSDIDSVIEELRLKFVMKDLGRVKHLLSMEIVYEPGVLLCLSQSAYIEQLLDRFRMNTARTVGSPQVHNEKMLPIEKEKCKINDPSIPYRELVGKLQYLTLPMPFGVLVAMLDLYEPGVLLCLSRSAYIEQLLDHFRMNEARTVGSPQVHNEKMLPIEKEKCKINDPSIPYRELVGKLQYLVSCTRPDIANAVRCLGRHAGSYTRENFSNAKRVLQYLRGTRNHGLVYRKSDAESAIKLQLCAYSDTDHANCPDTSRSISGYVLQLGNWSFGFKSKTQKTVTDGTCKSELVAASTCVESLMWAQSLLVDIGMDVHIPNLRLDYQSTI